VVSHSSSAADAAPRWGQPWPRGRRRRDETSPLSSAAARLKGLAEELKLRAEQLQRKADALR